MERSLFRYIIQPHLARPDAAAGRDGGQLSADLHQPRDSEGIVNNAIGGKNIPQTFLGFEVTQISYLMALSFLLLALITLNGVIKYWLNVYRGVIGERTMRRMRHELYQQVLRFPLPQFKTMSSRRDHPDDRRRDRARSAASSASRSACRRSRAACSLTYMVFIFKQDSGSASPRSRSIRRRSG